MRRRAPFSDSWMKAERFPIRFHPGSLSCQCWMRGTSLNFGSVPTAPVQRPRRMAICEALAAVGVMFLTRLGGMKIALSDLALRLITSTTAARRAL